MNKINRIGERKLNNLGLMMEVIEYKKYNDVYVKFEESGYIVNTKYGHFKDGNIRDPYMPIVYNTGFMGDGEYTSKENGKITNRYLTWRSMIKRCYDIKQPETRATYKGCTVNEEWHNFQNFAKWYDENYYEIEGERMELDKDILSKGNKVYSSKTCLFVPQRINTLLINRKLDRGSSPLGVYFDKEVNKYKAHCATGNGKIKNLGRYKDKNKAFMVYKTFKENLIKRIAEEYKGKIPNKLYNALIEYEIEFND